jgi:flagellar hook-associated protein 3 FlgL
VLFKKGFVVRITTNMLYSNFIYDQQNTYSDLNKATNQLSSGMKIENIYDDSSVFNDTLRLDEEGNSLEQVVKTSKTAQTFANNTDTTMNDMTKTLSEFKTKLLQAANADNNDTSYGALADELEGLKQHLQTLANTSIDGKYLFSGTAFDTKPISDNGDYNGNDKNIKAKLGSNVEVAYNIDGKSLFEGTDKDYAKHISTNVKHFDAMKENPEFVVLKDGKYYIDKNIKEDGQQPANDTLPSQVSLSDDSQIRMLTGVSDKYDGATDSYTDATSYFYLSGRKPNGDTFNTKIALSNSSKISDLLDRIGEAFGNTPTIKAVDVSMNEFGQIEIKDATTGKMETDFNLVASDQDASSVDELVKNGAYVQTFIKSNFPSTRDIAKLSAQNKNFDNRIFTLNTEFRTIDDETYAKPTDTVFNVLGDKGLNKATTPPTRDALDHINLTGTDTNGNAVNVNLNVDSTTTMQDLEDEIKNNFGDVSVSLNDGKLVIYDNTIDKTGKSKLSFTMDAQNSANQSLSMFARMDGLTNDKTQFNVDGRLVSSNVAQIDKTTQTYATENTEMINVSGDDNIDGKRIDFNYTDKDGNIKRAYITLRDTPDVNGHLSTFTTIADDGTTNTYDIFDAQGNKTPIHDVTTTVSKWDSATCSVCNETKTTKGITYKQFDDVIGMLVSGNLPVNNDNADYQEAIKESEKYVDVGLKDGKLYIDDKQNSKTNIRMQINDNDTDNYDGSSSPVFTFNANDAVTVDEPKVDIFHQLDKMIQDVREGRVRMDGDSDNPRDVGIEGDIELIDHIFDHVIKKHTQIGAVSKSLQDTEDRTNMLVVHIESLKSDVIDVDMAKASMELQKLTLNYNAMLSTIAKVNNLSLVNYMR